MYHIQKRGGIRMKKIIIGVALSFIAILISIPLIRANMNWTRPTEIYYDVTIILDAGHGAYK